LDAVRKNLICKLNEVFYQNFSMQFYGFWWSGFWCIEQFPIYTERKITSFYMHPCKIDKSLYIN
jgi:hypothetical protein